MKKIILPLIILFVAFNAHAQNFEETLKKCPDFHWEQYEVFPYINTAIQLQKMGKKSAVAILRKYSEQEVNENKIIILCRMLFEKKENEMFRRPFIGGAVFLGNTDYEDWPNEPIEIIRGIPFLITRGYILAGRPERAIDYLEYCEDNTIWKKTMYTIPSGKDIKIALDNLIVLDKWKTQLTENEKEFLKSQIKI